MGYRHIDCAQAYNNEREIGEVIGEWTGSQARSSLFITSKVWNTNHAPEHVRPSVLKSIADLQCQYLDLLLIHWPIAWRHTGLDFKQGGGTPTANDGNVDWVSVPMQDTWRAMEALVQDGLVRSIGVSNFPLILLHELMQSAAIPPAVNQVELHPYLAQPALLAYCQSRGVHLSAYSPLGRPFRALEASVIYDKTVESVARSLSPAPDAYSPATVLLVWNVLRGVSVLPKSSTPARIGHNFRSTLALLQQVEQKAEDRTKLTGQLDPLDRNLRYCNLVMTGKDQGKFIRQGPTLFE